MNLKGGKKKKPKKKFPRPKNPKSKKLRSKRKVKKKAKKKGQHAIYSIRQPRRRNILKPRSSFRSMSYSDSSSYSNIMGKENFKRSAQVDENRDGRRRGAKLRQNNDMIILEKYPN